MEEQCYLYRIDERKEWSFVTHEDSVSKLGNIVLDYISLKLLRLRLASLYRSEYTFFGLTTCITESLSTLVQNELKFPSFSGALSLEITNMHGTAKTLSTNLTRTCFFFSNINTPFHKNYRLIICLLILRRLSCHKEIFFAACSFHRSFFMFSFTPENCNSTSFDVLFPDLVFNIWKNFRLK